MNINAQTINLNQLMTCLELTETHHTQLPRWLDPYKLMMNREVQTKIEQFPSDSSPKDQEVRHNDWNYKEWIKQYHDNRYWVAQLQLEAGQAVVIKRKMKRKTETPYEPHIYLIIKVQGSAIYASRLSDGKTICWDASRFKLLKTDTRSTNDGEARMSNPTQIPPAYCSQQPEIATQSRVNRGEWLWRPANFKGRTLC